MTRFQEITKHGVPLAVGGPISLTKQTTDLRDTQRNTPLLAKEIKKIV